MAYILSTGLQEAEYEYSQDTVQSLIYNLFPLKSHEKKTVAANLRTCSNR